MGDENDKRKRGLRNNYKKQIRLEDQNTRLPRWMEWFWRGEEGAIAMTRGGRKESHLQ